ncbi:Uncharacterised protein [uncultured archaeon]|nr:Uncharacterised protein [uncultured archaeon]
MSFIPSLNIPSLSTPSPHAHTLMFFPNNGTTTSGLKIPAPPSSIHPNCGCFANSSALGSVNGKYPGTIRISSASANSFANICSNPTRCLNVSPSCIIIPSVWLKSGRCVASMTSCLKTLVIPKYFPGICRSFDASILALQAVPCVLSTCRCVLSASNWYLQPVLPVLSPFSCAACTLLTILSSSCPYFGSLM